MRIIETKVFKFDELPEDAQTKAIENLYDINTDYEWYDSDIDYHVEKLQEYGFNDAKISFSGFFSQGDGASFTANMNLEKIINNAIYCDKSNSKFYHLLPLLENNLIELSGSIERSSFQYSHENTCYVNLFNDYYTTNTSAFDTWFDSLIADLESYIEDLRHDLCFQIYYSLRNQYEYLTGEEAIKETILCNEYEFTIDGQLI